MTRVIRTRTPDAPSTSKLEGLMEAYGNAEALAAQAAAALSRAKEAVEKEMKRVKLTEFAHDFIKAEFVKSPGRATNIIDPEGFHGLCPDDKSFYSAVSVSNTKARTIVPMRQLDGVTTNIPAKPGEESLKITIEPSR